MNWNSVVTGVGWLIALLVLVVVVIVAVADVDLTRNLLLALFAGLALARLIP